MPKRITAGRQRWRTICEVHREMYRKLMAFGVSPDAPIMVDLKEAYDLGKKIVNRLRANKKNFDDGWYEKNKLAGGEIDEPQPDDIPREDMQP